MQRKNEVIVTAIAFAAMLAGCAHNQVKTAESSGAGAAGMGAVGSAGASQGEPDVRGSTMVEIPEVQMVRFDYDSSALTLQARAALKSNAKWLKAHRDVRVQIAGNCDERGTVEYNLALGQRRAAAVRAYYRHLGIAGRRIATISYGKERPLCQEHNESCWAQNRRAETLRAAVDSASTR